jgi:hypothetical protein
MIISEKFPVKKILVVGMLLVLGSLGVKAQCLPQVRKYATVQRTFNSLTASINNAQSAIDGNPLTYSTLNVPVGLLNLLSATQYLEFTSGNTYLPANTPVTIKLSLPTSVLGVIDNVSIQATEKLRYDNGALGVGARYLADGVGPKYSGAPLLNLLNGSGELEITIIPTLPFQGVSISIASVLGLAVSAKVYDAYYYQNGPINETCNGNVDVLSGIRSGTVVGGIANATGVVSNPLNAIDNDPSNTYATLDLGIQVLSEVFHTTVFKSIAQAGDAVQMIIQKPEGGLLDLNLLNGFSVRMYNGGTPVGTAFSSSSGLSLTLLPGSTAGNEKYTLTIPVPKSAGAFDRVELKMGGVLLASLIPGLRIYDVKHIVFPKTAINGVNVPSTEVCFGSTATLSITELQDCTTYNWYATATGGNSIHVGTTPFTPSASSLVVGQNIFYLEAKRTNCTDVNIRIPVTIKVNPLPTAIISGTASVCQSATTPSVLFTGANGVGPYTFTYKINTGNNQTITTTTGNSISLIVPNSVPGEYKYILLEVKDNGGTQCSQPQNSFATVTVTAKPTPPTLTINVNN